MAAVTAKFKVYYPEWIAAFEDWVRVSTLGIVDAWKLQGRYIAQMLVDGKSPRGPRMWNQSTPPNDRKQGENAMARDIRRAIFPLKASGFRDEKVRKRVQKVVSAEDIGALQALANAGVFGAEHRGVKVIPAGNEFTAHQASRKSRGRVTAKTQPYAEPGDRYLKQYIHDSRHAVGQAKGGWVSSLMRLGGRAAGWITRHIRAGSYRDNLKPNQNNLSFTMINRSKWASGGDEDRIIDRVLANRGEMVKADIALMLQNNWKRTPTGRAVPR